MKAVVDVDVCTGCGLYADICPQVFLLEDDLAVVITDPVPDDSIDDCREAAESRPVEAIILE
jgi:ferredoxin